MAFASWLLRRCALLAGLGSRVDLPVRLHSASPRLSIGTEKTHDGRLIIVVKAAAE
jgi:hypothetical protein